MLKAIPKEYHDTHKGTLKLLWEDEWRALGITQVKQSITTNIETWFLEQPWLTMPTEPGLGALRGSRA